MVGLRYAGGGRWSRKQARIHRSGRAVTLAVGRFDVRYAREYYDYKQGETRARIRHYGQVKEQ